MLTFELGSGEEGKRKKIILGSLVIGPNRKWVLQFHILLNEIQTTSIRKMIVHLFEKTIFNKIETI